MNLRRIATLVGAMLLGVLVLGLDVLRYSVDLDVAWLLVVRDLMVIAAFVLLYLFLELSEKERSDNTIRGIGLILIAGIVVSIATAVVALATDVEPFEAKEGILLPLSFRTIFVATFINFSLGLFSILLFRLLHGLVLYKRKRGTKRNLTIQIVLMLCASVSTIGVPPLERNILTTILFGLAVASMVLNSFRLSWIVYLTRREKVFSLVYGFLLFGLLTVLNIITRGGIMNQLLLYHSSPMREFSSLALIFGNIYFGMAFVSTLFHLPTAEEFERKTTEITSLHNLGKLINQVFDFNELVDTVTSMTLQVCEAKACWLEILQGRDEGSERRPRTIKGMSLRTMTGGRLVHVVGMKNIGMSDIERLLPFSEHTLRDSVIEERKPVVVDSLSKDRRVKASAQGAKPTGSLVVVPLVSHSEMIGILYATKETEFGFFKDDVDVISAFADQATIALENSRLIDQSLERERLTQEMMLAQEMQKRLLPQSLPRFPVLQLDAVSTPAFEVGGDYYDFALLKNDRLGIVVGDVSGKGVSAAFYMSEVKGIFQSLSKICSSPRELLLAANEALAGSIDRRSFVSLIYSVVDLNTGTLTLSRAGHCPMILAKASGVTYIRPSGMGLGLCEGAAFADAIEEQVIRLDPGDVCVFYTDGVTEARRGEDEFGYERLLECIKVTRVLNATEVKNRILDTVKSFSSNEIIQDDLTLVVLKWHGSDAHAQSVVPVNGGSNE